MRNREQPSTAVSYRQDHLRCTETKSRKAVIIASRMCLSVTLSLFLVPIFIINYIYNI